MYNTLYTNTLIMVKSNVIFCIEESIIAKLAKVGNRSQLVNSLLTAHFDKQSLNSLTDSARIELIELSKARDQIELKMEKIINGN